MMAHGLPPDLLRSLNRLNGRADIGDSKEIEQEGQIFAGRNSCYWHGRTHLW